MGTVPLWKGAASAEGPPAVHLSSPRDLRRPFQDMDQVLLTHCRSEPLVPAAAPLTGCLPFWTPCQVDKGQETDTMQSFGSVAVFAAPVVVLFLAAARFVAVAAAAAAFVGFVAVAPVAAAGDTAAASAAVVVAVAFVAVGFAVAVNAAVVAVAAV